MTGILRSRVRPITLSSRSMSRRRWIRFLGEDIDPAEAEQADRPRTWGECKARGLGTVYHCPFVSCAYHLYTDIDPWSGNIRVNFPDKEVWELEDTCALAVAERGEHTLDQVGARLNITRERVRQIEERALIRVKLLMRKDPRK